jgi:ribonucleoside-diphosphate reductase alpha chain
MLPITTTEPANDLAVARSSDSEVFINSAEPSNGSQSPPQAVRNYLPDERLSVTHKFNVGGYEGYITVGLYPDSQPGELFITMAKEGSTVSGLVSSFGKAVSIGLQHGVPLQVLCSAFSHTRFEPSGWTGNPDIGCASSIMDYVFRWLALRFLKERPVPGNQLERVSPTGLASTTTVVPATPAAAGDAGEVTDAPSCKVCGAIMRRNGACHVCAMCGWTSGCG